MTSSSNPDHDTTTTTDVRVTRRKLEQMLRDGLRENPRCGYALEKIHVGGRRRDGVKLSFSLNDGEKVDSSSDILVATDGAHSQVRRIFSPSSELIVQPYAVYNGKRRVDRAVFDEHYAPHIKDKSNVLEHRLENNINNSTTTTILLQLSLNYVDENTASLSYTYSRPAQQQQGGGSSSDPLFTPNRPTSGARSIPSELFDEIDALNLNNNVFLPTPFNMIFNSQAMRKDSLLNWLQRSVLVPQADLKASAKEGVLLIGCLLYTSPSPRD